MTTLRDRLSAIGQDQVFRFFDSLDAAGKQKLTSQLEALDPEYIKHLADTQVKTKASLDLPREIKPVTAYPNKPDAKHRGLYADAERRGRELLRAGKVAAFLVAGGQGTRL